METAAKMNEQFATGRFACGCEIVDADLSADERGHDRGVTRTAGRSIGGEVGCAARCWQFMAIRHEN